MKKPILLFMIILFGLLSSGCVMLMEYAADRPYRKSMERGTLSPHEYRQISDQIDRDARHWR